MCKNIKYILRVKKGLNQQPCISSLWTQNKYENLQYLDIIALD